MILYWRGVWHKSNGIYPPIWIHIFHQPNEHERIFPVHSISLMHNTYESFKSPNYPSCVNARASCPFSLCSGNGVFDDAYGTNGVAIVLSRAIGNVQWNEQDRPRTSSFWIVVNVAVVLSKFLSEERTCVQTPNWTTYFCSGSVIWRNSIKEIFYIKHSKFSHIYTVTYFNIWTG